MEVIIIGLIVAALILSGIDLARSHGQDLTAWAAFLISIALVIVRLNLR